MFIAFAAALYLAPVSAQDANLQEQMTKLADAISQADEAVADRTSDAYLTNMPLARLKLRKALAFGRWPYGGPADARQEIVEAEEALARLAADTTAFVGETGHIERAYTARNDETAQPYYAYVPEDYDPGESWPLIVFLHGYVPTTSIIDPWVLEEEKEKVAEANGAILLTPYGRRNTDFQGVGEVDVLRAVEEMKRFYSIDDDRVYMGGPSMGGMGTWTIALRHPGVFAASAPMCAQTDMFVWWPWPHETAPKFKQFLGEWDNPIELAANAVGQGFFLQHGEFDRKPLIPAEQSHMMAWELDRLGTPIEYFEHEGEDHFIYWRLPCYEKAFSWLVQQKRDRSTKRVRIRSFSYRYDTAFWLTFTEYERWGTPGLAEATVEGNRITLTTENVAGARINLDDCPVDADKPVEVVANGEQVFSGKPTGESLDVTIAESQPKQGTLRKKKGLCGPVEDVFNGPFLIVAGTSGSEEEKQESISRAQRWMGEWDQFADGIPPGVTDVGVTDELIGEKNLVLFGTPDTNSVLARIADQLPVKWLADGYALGGQEYTGDDLGLVLCYPNPLNSDRYVLIYSGENALADLGVNHKHDLLPDYFIFTTADAYRHDDMYRHLCAGFFDLNWQVDPELMDTDGDMTNRYFGSADTVRVKGQTQPSISIANGYAEALHLKVDDGEEITLEPGEKHEATLAAGRHHVAARCPDGVTRTETRLMVPEFQYEWRVPPLRGGGLP